MTCNEFKKIIMTQHPNTSSAGERAAMLRHCRGCEACNTWFMSSPSVREQTEEELDAIKAIAKRDLMDPETGLIIFVDLTKIVNYNKPICAFFDVSLNRFLEQVITFQEVFTSRNDIVDNLEPELVDTCLQLLPQGFFK